MLTFNTDEHGQAHIGDFSATAYCTTSSSQSSPMAFCSSKMPHANYEQTFDTLRAVSGCEYAMACTTIGKTSRRVWLLVAATG